MAMPVSYASFTGHLRCADHLSAAERSPLFPGETSAKKVSCFGAKSKDVALLHLQTIYI